MFKHISMWNLKPGVDPEVFEKHYLTVHVPLVVKLPGQRKYVISKVRQSKSRKTPFYRMVENIFDDLEGVRRMLASPEAAAAAGDQRFHEMVQDNIQFICESEEVPLPTPSPEI